MPTLPELPERSTHQTSVSTPEELIQDTVKRLRHSSHQLTTFLSTLNTLSPSPSIQLRLSAINHHISTLEWVIECFLLECNIQGWDEFNNRMPRVYGPQLEWEADMENIYEMLRALRFRVLVTGIWTEEFEDRVEGGIREVERELEEVGRVIEGRRNGARNEEREAELEKTTGGYTGLSRGR